MASWRLLWTWCCSLCLPSSATHGRGCDRGFGMAILYLLVFQVAAVIQSASGADMDARERRERGGGEASEPARADTN